MLLMEWEEETIRNDSDENRTSIYFDFAKFMTIKDFRASFGRNGPLIMARVTTTDQIFSNDNTCFGSGT